MRVHPLGIQTHMGAPTSYFEHRWVHPPHLILSYHLSYPYLLMALPLTAQNENFLRRLFHKSPLGILFRNHLIYHSYTGFYNPMSFILLQFVFCAKSVPPFNYNYALLNSITVSFIQVHTHKTRLIVFPGHLSLALFSPSPRIINQMYPNNPSHLKMEIIPPSYFSLDSLDTHIQHMEGIHWTAYSIETKNAPTKLNPFSFQIARRSPFSFSKSSHHQTNVPKQPIASQNKNYPS
jgi:hypothetical protein